VPGAIDAPGTIYIHPLLADWRNSVYQPPVDSAEGFSRERTVRVRKGRLAASKGRGKAGALIFSFGTLPAAERWLEETCNPFRLLLDPERTVYKAYGLERSLARSWNLRTIWRYVQLLTSGRRWRSIQGDSAQLGGDFVVDANGIVQLAHRSHDPAQHPPRLSHLLDRRHASIGRHPRGEISQRHDGTDRARSGPSHEMKGHGEPNMNRHFSWAVIALAALLLVSACGATPVPPTATATATSPAPSPTEPPAAEPSPLPVAGEKGNADVLHVRAVQSSDGNWTFHVTVQHPDTGWEDYADGWDVLTPDDQVLKPDPDSPFTRLLLHPHENEQPFTRSQAGIIIPSGVSRVRVRAHDLVDGYGGREMWVDLTAASGEGFEVESLP